MQGMTSESSRWHRFVDEGLFRYCRHPNYFGEMLLWTSLTVLAGGPGVLAAHPWVAVSPAFTIFLLTQASGALAYMPSFLSKSCGDGRGRACCERSILIILRLCGLIRLVDASWSWSQAGLVQLYSCGSRENDTTHIKAVLRHIVCEFPLQFS